MRSPASHPAGVLTIWQRKKAKYLVKDCGLRPNGLSPEALERIFQDPNKLSDFTEAFQLCGKIGSGFWHLITEVNEDLLRNQAAQSPSAATSDLPVVPTATSTSSDRPVSRISPTHETPDRTPGLHRQDSAQRPQGAKRSSSVAAQDTNGVNEPSPETVVEPGAKRRRNSKTPVARPQETKPLQCPGTYNALTDTQVPCKKTYCLQKALDTHWSTSQGTKPSHRSSYKLKPPNGKFHWRCIQGCPKLFKDEESLKNHQFSDHAPKGGDASRSSSASAPVQNVDSNNVVPADRAQADGAQADGAQTAAHGPSQSYPEPYQDSQLQDGAHSADIDTSENDPNTFSTGQFSNSGLGFIDELESHSQPYQQYSFSATSQSFGLTPSFALDTIPTPSAALDPSTEAPLFPDQHGL